MIRIIFFKPTTAYDFTGSLVFSRVLFRSITDTVDAYTQRIGRTGRAHQSGEAFTFAEQSDGPRIHDIEKLLGVQIERRRLPDFNYGNFVPESQFQERHSTSPQKKLSRHTQNRYRNNKGRNSSRRQWQQHK